MPRQGPTIVRRARIEEWLERFKSAPVRFLIAPPGFGKTMALLDYLRHRAANGYYCALPAGATKEAVWGELAGVLGEDAGFASQEELLDALTARAPLELAIDCAAVPGAGGVATILRLVEEVPEGVSLLIACRSRAAFQVRDLVSRGLAALCDAERLAFCADEIRHLSETCGVRFASVDVVRMLELTEGWPLVVSGAICKAAEDNCSLHEAFGNWRTRRGHFLNEFIAAVLAQVPEEHAALVYKLMAGSQPDDLQQLQALEEQGLFVTHTADGYQALRALSRSNLYRRYASALPASPMQVRLFGWFEAEIDGRPIQWVRRRDREIFQYVSLKSGGIVSRSEIGEAFWPGVEKHLVAQSLRTACSNIRKAIACVVGFDQVGIYFRTGHSDVSIDPDNVVVDVKSFIAHANDGDEQYDRGELKAALTHYRLAEELRTGSLLIGHASGSWVALQAAELEQRHLTVLERLSEISADRQREAWSDASFAAGA
jgi:hypothetical protein